MVTVEGRLIDWAQPYPRLGQNEDGNLEVFAWNVADNANLWHRGQISLPAIGLMAEPAIIERFQYSSRLWQGDEGLPDNSGPGVGADPRRVFYGWNAGRTGFDLMAWRSRASTCPAQPPRKNPSSRALR